MRFEDFKVGQTVKCPLAGHTTHKVVKFFGANGDVHDDRPRRGVAFDDNSVVHEDSSLLRLFDIMAGEQPKVHLPEPSSRVIECFTTENSTTKYGKPPQVGCGDFVGVENGDGYWHRLDIRHMNDVSGMHWADFVREHKIEQYIQYTPTGTIARRPQ